MKAVKAITACLLCVVLVASSLLLLGALFLRNLVFGPDFYMTVISAPAYQSMVHNAILDDLERQGRYVDIPLDVLAAGLDESLIISLQQWHIQNLVGYLNFRADFLKPVYPAERFRGPLLDFIEGYADEHDFLVTDEQIDQLEEVAVDAAAIVQLHTTLFDLSQMENSSAFQRNHRLIHDLSHHLGLALTAWVLALLGLILLHLRSWRRWLSQLLISIWLCGSLLLVPALVLDRFSLHRRLALETPYLQFAVSRLLQQMIRVFMIFGAGLFVCSSIALIVLFLTRTDIRLEKPSGRTDEDGRQ